MASYLLRRTIQILLTLFAFICIVFFLVNAQPGDISNVYAMNPELPPDARERLQAQFGLNQPLWQQFLVYVKNVFTGSFGVSFSHYPRSVADVIAERLPRTVALFFTATVFSFYLGFMLGKIIAWKRGGWTEYATTLGGVTLYTVFTPWFALMMIWLFAFKAGWFPIGKFLDPILWREAPIDANTLFGRMMLTALALSIIVFAVFVVTTRLRVAGARLIQLGSLVVAVGVMIGVWRATGFGELAWDIIKHMILPVFTLTLISFAGTMLLTRNSMLETMREDFVLAARAKGLPEKAVRDKHVARNRPAAGGDQPGIQPGIRRRWRRHHRVGLFVARHGADAGVGGSSGRPAPGGRRVRLRRHFRTARPLGRGRDLRLFGPKD